MAAPKNPNTEAATAARRRLGEQSKADALREAGWLVMPPEALPELRDHLTDEGRAYVASWQSVLTPHPAQYPIPMPGGGPCICRGAGAPHDRHGMDVA